MLETLITMPTEHWLTIAGIIMLFSWGGAILLFNRISLKHIDTEMAKEGITPPEWDKGIGARGLMYAMVIFANKAAKVSPIEDEAVLRHTRAIDRKLAKFYVISSIICFFTVFIFYFAYGADN